MLQLRPYQERTLEALSSYFGKALEVGAKRAFIEATDRPYRSFVHADVSFVQPST
jgi:hypothetical protein